MNKQRELSSFSRAIGVDMPHSAPVNPQPVGTIAIAAESADQAEPSSCRITCFEPESQERWP